MTDKPSDPGAPTQMATPTPTPPSGGAVDLSDYSESVRALAKDGILLKRFRLQKVLGQGGMGVVWLAHDLELNETVALKFLPSMVARDEAALDELKGEVRRSRRLTHDNIVRVHDYLQGEDWAAISMEFVKGKNLSALRLQEPAHVFSARKLAPLIPQLCAALDYAHNEAKMVHHDLKPANLMVTDKGKLKVCDFGIARSLSESVTRLTTKERTSGTLIYMSPQHLMGEDPSVADDIYSLGATIYELLTGKPPFYSGNIASQVMDKVPPSMMQRREALGITSGPVGPTAASTRQPPAANAVEPIPPEWEETVAACLSKEEADRPPSGAEIVRRLRLDTTSAHAPEPKTEVRNVPVQISERRSRKPILIGAGVLALLFIGLVAGYFGSHRSTGPSHHAESPRVSIQITRLEEERQKKELEAKASADATERARLEAEAKKAADEVERLKAEKEIAERERAAAEKAKQKENEPLSKARGGVIIRTSPEGALVTLGGDAIEKSPATFKSIPLGKYPVKILLDGYEPRSLEIEIKENEFVDPGEITLTRSTGGLQINSAPEGIPFEVRDFKSTIQSGKTPHTLKDLPCGEYEVILRRPDWPEVRQTVKVPRQETAVVSRVFKTGRLKVTSEPVGMEIFEGSKSLGKTPFEVELCGGRHELVARFGRLGEKKVEAMVEGDKLSEIAVAFELGKATIQSDPPGAEVSMNGHSVGKTPLTNFVLPAGEYEVEFNLADHNRQIAKLAVKAGEEKKISVPLVNPGVESWKKIAGRYRGTIKGMTGAPVGKTAEFDIEIQGTSSSPIVTYTKDQNRLYLMGGVHTCSNDPGKRSKYPITVRFSKEEGLVIEGHDQWRFTRATHTYTLKFKNPGEASLTSVIGRGTPQSWTESGTLKKAGE